MTYKYQVILVTCHYCIALCICSFWYIKVTKVNNNEIFYTAKSTYCVFHPTLVDLALSGTVKWLMENLSSTER